MLRFAGLALLACLAFAQKSVMPPEPAPPEVDAALRARINEFYGYFVSQQFRKAEKLIAEDSQDWFYDHNKPHYLSFQITRIDYKDHFTRADVLTLCEQNILMIGFSGAMKIPTPSTWKLVDGQWYWYIDKDQIAETPFGKIPQRASNGAEGPLGRLPVIPNSADFAMNKVKPETSSLAIRRGASAQVAITNTAHGPATLTVEGKPAGIEATLDHGVLTAGQKAVLSIQASANAKPGRILLRVHETNELIPIQIQIN